MAYISIDDVHKNYNSTRVLKGFSLSVDRHEVACLIGPSGCGKSTVLRCINGLEPIDAGDIRVGDITVSEELADTNTLRKRVGIVFQQFNLFPHMTALENASLGPRRVLKTPREESEQIAYDLLDRVGLAKKAKRYPDALSGGEQQRVAIARALAMRPDALLLDEVTSALDPELVGEVLNIVRELASEGMTMVLATHEMGFAREVATQVCFVSEGIVYEAGEPEQFFGNPQKPKTQTFLKRLTEARRI
ncbi:MAG: amino acid ABC transporter ATP-binding protein [Brucellaceae bacterium]|nr:amino acid ABC transporter ATP-binding protein [Brucellaceae bacterium]